MSCFKNIYPILFLLLGLTNFSWAQNESITNVKSYHFPDDWLGYWEGTLDIIKHDSIIQSLPMALDHTLTDTVGVYTWAIIYGADIQAGRRDYILKTIDKDKGHYITDEKNSILLDSYLFDNQLISTFEVMGSLIVSKYQREPDHLLFEIIAANHADPNISGNTVMELDSIPLVHSYPVNVLQRARLKRVRHDPMKYYDLDGKEIKKKRFDKKVNNPPYYFDVMKEDGWHLIERDHWGKLDKDGFGKICKALKINSYQELDYVVINFYPGQDQFNKGGTKDPKWFLTHYLNLESYLTKNYKISNQYIYKNAIGLDHRIDIEPWKKDPLRLIEKTFFEYHYWGSSYVIIRKDGKYKAFYGEYAYEQIADDLKLLNKESK